MKKIAIIGCGKSKVWAKHPDAGPTIAKDVYVGGFVNKLKEYVNKFYGDDWYILSAKYGLIHNSFVIPESYDVTFNKKSTNPISVELLREQISKLDIDSVEVVAGKKYTDMVKEAVNKDVEVITPLAGFKGMGYQMQFLTKKIQGVL